MLIPEPLPVDEVLVGKTEKLIRKMNRSERRRVHRTLLEEARTAEDKSITDNSNLVSCRLTRDDYASVLNICDDRGEELSAFLRNIIHKEIKEHQ